MKCYENCKKNATKPQKLKSQKPHSVLNTRYEQMKNGPFVVPFSAKNLENSKVYYLLQKVGTVLPAPWL